MDEFVSAYGMGIAAMSREVWMFLTDSHMVNVNMGDGGDVSQDTLMAAQMTHWLYLKLTDH